MQDQSLNDGLTAAERELEAALGGLRPAVPALDRDGMVFAAGRAAGRAESRRQTRCWQAAAAALALAAGLSLVLRAGPGTHPDTPYAPHAPLVVHQPPPEPAPPQRAPLASPTVVSAGPMASFWLMRPAPGTYFDLRDKVLRRGLDALPQPTSEAPTHQPTISELLDSPQHG
jgi:hypothetical protein